MRRSFVLYTLLAAAVSTLAAPITQDTSNLGSYADEGRTDTDIVLPPIAEVFAIMATESALPSPPSTSIPSPPSPSTTVTPALSATKAIHLGPGPVLSASPSPSSAPEGSTSRQEPPTLAHRFLFASVVFLSIIMVILAIYAVSYQRHQLRLARLDREAQRRTLPAEKDLKGRSSVVHITRDFPRSKFSVTSSDYPVSARSSSSSESSATSSSSDEDSDGGRESYDSARGLMDPAHFFAMRASSMASRRHSRGGSAPVFGVPRFDARREQSRRSRSVSGPGEEEWS